MLRSDSEIAVAEFIRTRGVTRCPTAFVLPTRGATELGDRAALHEHAVNLDRLRRARSEARRQAFLSVEVPLEEIRSLSNSL
jgi:hypothetical protein